MPRKEEEKNAQHKPTMIQKGQKEGTMMELVLNILGISFSALNCVT
jgi:hypothetical protein